MIEWWQALLIALSGGTLPIVGGVVGWYLNSESTKHAERREAIREELRRDAEPLRQLLAESQVWHTNKIMGIASLQELATAGLDAEGCSIVAKYETAIFGAEPEELRGAVIDLCKLMFVWDPNDSEFTQKHHDLINEAQRIIRMRIADAKE